MAGNIEVIIGTYEEFLLGYRFEEGKGRQIFADNSHTGALKSVAVHAHWVATGGTDDRIFIYDMRSRKQTQIILTHHGTINTLAFTPDGSHILSGADDGHIICTRLNTWKIEANWKNAHNHTPVTAISCHPSGKLALSLGGDLVLRTWNLVKGRVAYKKNLKSRGTLGTAPECLTWSPNGNYFTLSGQRIVEFWSIKVADVVRTQKTSAKPTCVCWVSEATCLIGMEDGKIAWVRPQGEMVKDVISDAHKQRVKAMAFSHSYTLVTASSAGEVKMWQVDETQQRLNEIATVQIGCRPTCMSLLDLQQFNGAYILNETSSASNATGTARPDSIEEKKYVLRTSKNQQQTRSRSVVTVEYNDDDNHITAFNVAAQEYNSNNNDDKTSDDSSDESDEDNCSVADANKRKQKTINLSQLKKTQRRNDFLKKKYRNGKK